MTCIVCKIGKLEITNSRKHASELRVWRRRKCNHCGTLLTTREAPDFDRAFIIVRGKKKSDKLPFEKSRLIAQLFAAGGHIAQQEELLWLAETIAMKAFLKAAENSFSISSVHYRLLTLNVLEAYDKLLGANFEARNPA